MRIQHNIMAMSAYRNYNNNTSALSKNLEKLSSGYKINRAGDDAAGLAISEKMRAQITGLNAAQKNVKDGISLVKTAEGAMQEIHDMLNRMDYLATQSANGTYDNEVDRANLQKEVDALKTEINRIADSANFNGIQLLDGSLSKNGIPGVEGKFELPDVGSILGQDTVLHRDEDEASASTAFGLELHNMKFTGKKDDSFTIEIGGTKLIGTLQQDMTGDSLDTTLTGADMAAGLLGDTTKVKFTTEDGSDLDPSKVTIAGHEYSIAAGETDPTTGEGTGVLFKLNGSEADVDVSMDVNIYANGAEDGSTVKNISGTASANPISPSLGGITGKGTIKGQATVNVVTSGGTIDTSKIGLVKKNSVTNTGAVTDPLIAVVTGKPNKIEGTQTNNKITVELDAAGIQKVLNGLAGTGAIGNALALHKNATGVYELVDTAGTANVLGTFKSANIGADGTIEIAAADGTVLGKVTLSALAGKTTDATTAKSDLDAFLNVDVAVTGAKIATANFASGTALDNDKLTAAAVAAGAKGGDVTLDFNADTNQVQLMVGRKVIGYADAGQANGGALNFYDATTNASIGSMTLGGNQQLDSSNLAAFFKDNGPVDTGLDYADANVKSSVSGAIDYDKVSAAAKKAFAGADREITGNEKLSLAYNGTNFDLMLDDVKIGTGTLDVTTANAGKLVLKDLEGTPNTLATINLAGTAASQTFVLNSTTVFNDLGLSIKPEEKALSTTDTSALASTDAQKKALSKAITEAAIDAGVDLNGDVELTISYNEDASQYELKAGDVVVGTDAGTFTAGTGTLALTFTDAGGNTLGGAVNITGLAADYTATDLVGSISTGWTFDTDATPAVSADFSGLDSDKLLEFAEANGVAVGSKLEMINEGGGDWTLQFNDGTTTVEVGAGELSTDGMTIDFGDYGKLSLSDKYDETAITGAGAEELYDPIDTGLSLGETAVKSGLTGDYQKTTTDQMNSQQSGGDRLASTVLNLTSDMIKDGASIFVAGKTYTFSTNDDTFMSKDAVKVDISDLDAEKLGDNYMSAVAKRLTDTYAADNTGVYTLGWNGKNVTVTETLTHGNLKSDGSNDDTYPTNDEWDLRTFDGIKKSLGYSSAATEGKSLTLQIGDTSDKFNQMEVSVGDMHTSAMGTEGGAKIADVDISTQEGAAAAVQTIKDAINYVSSVRGDLGATQNRLEHTANNLSVMAENIQDAESTIRDTDIAEEMMAYTKNNILIQSAQAMLAQANAVPQGVLQLLG